MQNMICLYIIEVSAQSCQTDSISRSSFVVLESKIHLIRIFTELRA